MGTTVYAQQYDSTNQGKDGTGTSTVVSLQINNIDRTGPQITSVTFGKPDHYAYNVGTWCTQDIIHSLVATDSGVGTISSYQYSENNGNAVNCQVSGTWSANRNSNVKFRAIDTLGNIGSWTVDYNLKIDKSAPGTPTISGAHHNAWWTADYNVTLSSNEDISGISTYQYSFNNSSWTNCGGTYTCSGEQNRTIYFRAVNGAGLISDSSNFLCKIDKSAPGAPTISGAYNNTWKTANYNVTLSSSDGVSGISKYQYSFNNSSWTDCSSTYTCSGDQSRTIYFRAVNGAGLASGSNNFVCKIDTTPPVIGGSFTSSDSWSRVAFTCTLSYTENISGLSTYQYSTSKDGPWTNCTNTGNCSAEGNYYRYYRVVNGAGLTSTTANAQHVMYDKTPPNFKSFKVVNNNSSTYYIKVRIDFTDSLSGPNVAGSDIQYITLWDSAKNHIVGNFTDYGHGDYYVWASHTFSKANYNKATYIRCLSYSI